LSRLDLRLNVIENLTNIPITFKSGVIHELRIHIPWTRITSEPVVVTINTLEFVAKLKDTPGKSPNTSAASSSNLNKSQSANQPQQTPDASSTPPAPTAQVSQQQPVPAGYIQNIITKILFNICIIVNNVVVKFVEDDMVLSVNMKSAECFSVNHLWEKSYVDIGSLPQQPPQSPTNPQLYEFKIQNGEHHVRKILQLNDVTICLDKLDRKSSGKIDFYQDPLIYRCSIQSRLDFKFNSSLNLNNIDQQLKLIKLNFYCRKFEMSITDRQLPLVIRLIELILAILNGTLELPESSGSLDTTTAVSVEETLSVIDPPTMSQQFTTQLPGGVLIGEPSIGTEQLIINDVVTNGGDQGWLSWAWSYVPSVSDLLPAGGEEAGGGQQQSQQEEVQTPIQTIVGVYFDEFNLAFKLTKQVSYQQSQATSSTSSSKSFVFEPFVVCNLKGIAIEVNSRENFIHLLIGVSYMNLRSLNEC
jgi:vacuolar protein sorting-associated protein 13B